MVNPRNSSVQSAAVRAIQNISEVAGWIAAALILVAIFLTCQMIFIRFALNGSTVWQTEVVVYLVIAATLLGLPFVQKHKGHVSVDLLAIWLSPKASRILTLTTQSAAVLVIAICSFYGFEFWFIAFDRGWTSDTVTAVPLWIPYLCVPIGFALLLLQNLADLSVLLTTPLPVEQESL